MFWKRGIVAALGLLLLFSAEVRGAGPKSPPQFDITSYGAVPNDATDDTAAIQRALVQALANTPCELVIPRGYFIVQDPGTGSYATANDGPINVPYTARDLVIRGEGAVLRIGPNGISTSAIRIFGSRVRVSGITVDVNADDADASARKAKGNSGFEANAQHPDGDANDGTDVTFENCFYVNGYLGDDAVSQGSDGFALIQGTRCAAVRCAVTDATWTGFNVSGVDVSVLDCSCSNQRGNGLRIQDGTNFYIRNFRTESDRCHGRSGILADAGSAAGSDERSELLIFDNCFASINPDGTGENTNGVAEGAGSALKIASARKAVVYGGRYIAGEATNNVAVRLEDSLLDVAFYGSKIESRVLFTPSDNDDSSVYQGLVTSITDNGAGKCRFLLSNSGSGPNTLLAVGKSLFVHGSTDVEYNREHIVEVKSMTPYTVDTDIDFNTSTIGTACYARSGVDTARFYNCEFGSATFGLTGSAQEGPFFANTSCRVLEIEGCRFRALGANSGTYNALNWYPVTDAGFELIRLVDNDLLANSAGVFRLINPETANNATALISTGKTIGYNNRLVNLGGGGTAIANTATANYARQLLFSTDGESKRRFVWTTAPNLSDTRTVFAPGDVWVQQTAQGDIDWQCYASGVSGTSTNSWAQKSAPYRFVGTVDGTPVANFDANEEVSATPTGVGDLRFGGLRSMNQGEGVRFSASGVYSTTGTPTLNFGMSFGKSQIGNGSAGSPVGTAAETGRTKIMEVGAFTTPSGASNRRWRITGAGIIKTTGSSGVMTVTGTIAYETAADTWTTKEIGPTDVTVNTSNTTTHNRKMDVWAAWGTPSASNTFTCQQFEISPR